MPRVLADVNLSFRAQRLSSGRQKRLHHSSRMKGGHVADERSSRPERHPQSPPQPVIRKVTLLRCVSSVFLASNPAEGKWRTTLVRRSYPPLGPIAMHS